MKLLEKYFFQVLQDCANKLIERVEGIQYQNKVRVNAIMNELLEQLQEHFATMQPIEEELKAFTSGLSMFFNDIK